MITLHPEFLNRQGKPEFAVLPIEEFNLLQDYLEQMEDLLELRQAKQAEGDAPSIGLEKMRMQLAQGS